MRTVLKHMLFLSLSFVTASVWAVPLVRAQEEAIDRRVLPVAEPARKPITAIDARDVQVPPRFEVKAPVGAPNVVIVLIDDLGFGVPDAF